MVITMNTLSRILSVVLVGATLSLSVGCMKAKPKPPVGQGSFPNEVDATQYAIDGSDNVDGSEYSEGAYTADETGTMPENLGGDQMPEGSPVPELSAVYFEYDQDVLTGSAKETLKKNAQYLKSNQNLNVVLRGHTDEDGTEDYNYSLGSRRALAARDFLIAEGIDQARVHTVSFGETLPAQEGEDESTKSRNRRVEFFVYILEE